MTTLMNEARKLTPRRVLCRVKGEALVYLLDTPCGDLAAHRLLLRDERPIDPATPPAAIGTWLLAAGYPVSRRYALAFGRAYREALDARGGKACSS